MLHDITPVLLTYNEAPNIERTLSALSWAKDIVIVDSFSDDETLAIARRHPNVRIFQRAFDQHALQWNYAIGETGIKTGWTFALDADYVLSPELIAELRATSPDREIAGFVTPFEYVVFGAPLRGSVYPAKVTLFRTGAGRYEQDGHTQKLALPGRIGTLRAPIRHDDRKSFPRWLASQNRYMQYEAAKLRSTPSRELSVADRVRSSIVLGPVAMFFYCYLYKRNVLDGRAGLYYAFQRTIAELILSAYLLEARLGERPSGAGVGSINHEGLS